MKAVVCYPMRSLVKAFMPSECSTVVAEDLTECLLYAAVYKPEVCVIFTESVNQPVWEWLPTLSEAFPPEMIKVIIPVYKDEQLVNRIVEAKGLPHTYVLPASLSYEEIGSRLCSILGFADKKVNVLANEAWKENRGLVFTLTSYGSAGVTTFCINLPVLLAKQHPGMSVAVVDMNIEKPDLTGFFGLSGHQLSLYRPDLVTLQAADQRNWLAAFKRSPTLNNLYYTCGASRWESYEISTLLAVFRKRFDFVFIDWGYCFPETEAMQRLQSECDFHLMFVRSDPFSLSNAARWFGKQQKKGVSHQLVISHFAKEGISLQRIKEVTGAPVFGKVSRLQESRAAYSLQSNSILVEEIFPPKDYISSLQTFVEEITGWKGAAICK
ncbi:hypothetical protein ACI7RC_23545 [Brevibacillus sp. B_LB10_24]|uniref:hypothetical protein n=1 Tax=Brevibacillus sp. B_LB10_24 TaxID=3380645 RepID=UPI0038BA6C2C